VDRTLKYLSGGGVQRQFVVGAPIRLPVPGAQPGDIVTVIGPEAINQSVTLQAAGAAAVLHLDGVALAGVYRVEPREPGKGWSFAVNTGRAASPLVPMDADALAAWWSPADFELVGIDAALARLDAAGHGWSLWPLLIVLGGLVLIAETVYVNRLCPRSNPVVVESVVPQRGILKPVTEKS
jgi:hypothetical protein